MLQPGFKWSRPDGECVGEVLHLAKLTRTSAAPILGLGTDGRRTVRRWISGESNISYANWALLCHLAGLGAIWRGNHKITWLDPSNVSIYGLRPEWLLPAPQSTQPDGKGVEVLLTLSRLNLCTAALCLGLGGGGERTVRRWLKEETKIGYASWALLCDLAGFRTIWDRDRL